MEILDEEGELSEAVKDMLRLATRGAFMMAAKMAEEMAESMPDGITPSQALAIYAAAVRATTDTRWPDTGGGAFQ